MHTMKKKLIVLNCFLMLSVLFSVSYQSIHAFSHHHHNVSCDNNHKSEEIAFKKTISEKEECPICDFKFTSFLKADFFSFTFHSPFKQSPYSFSVKEATSFFCGSLFLHRGPPSQI